MTVIMVPSAQRDPVRAIVDCANLANEALRGAALRDAIDRVAALRDRADLSFNGAPLTDLLRPALLPVAVLEDARARAEAVARVLRHVADAAAASPSARARMKFSSTLEFLFELDRAAPSARVAGRIDGFVDDGGTYRVLEYNALAPGGMYENDALRSTFLDSLLLKQELPVRLASRSCLDEAHDVLWSMFGRAPRMAVITSQPVDLDADTDSNILRFFLTCRERGFPFVSGTPGELACTERGVLLRDELIDVIVVGDPAVPGPLLFTLGSNMDLFRRHLETGTVRFLNGLMGGRMLSYKALFAIISAGDDEELLGGVDAGALALAQDTIPWTRRLLPGTTTLPDGTRGPLETYVVDHREELVIKPNKGLGGHGVLLGWMVSPEAWERDVVARLPHGDDIVQRRVRPVEVAWPRLVGSDVETSVLATSLDLWVWRDEIATFGYARTLTGGLANQSRGSVATTVFGL